MERARASWGCRLGVRVVHAACRLCVWVGRGVRASLVCPCCAMHGAAARHMDKVLLYGAARVQVAVHMPRSHMPLDLYCIGCSWHGSAHAEIGDAPLHVYYIASRYTLWANESDSDRHTKITQRRRPRRRGGIGGARSSHAYCRMARGCSEVEVETCPEPRIAAMLHRPLPKD